MSDASSHSCPSSSRTAIAITLAGTQLEMVRCSGCDGQWWERDGARVPLPTLLPLLKDSRNAPRAAGARKARAAAESPVVAAARRAAAELAAAERRDAGAVTAAASSAPVRRVTVVPDPTAPRQVDLTDGAEESSLLFRQLLAFQEAAARESH